VACDPVLSARVLQVANSALYGLQSRVGTLRRAVQMLGLEGTRGVAFALAVSALGREGGPEARDLYDHAVATGAVVKLLAPHVPGVHAGLMYATALVHDLGLQLLLILEPGSTAEMLRKLGHNKNLVHAERLHFGFDHAQLGAAGLLRWGLPEPAAELVQLHHQPLAGKHRARALIQVADHVAEGLLDEGLEPEDLADRGQWHPVAPLLCVPPRVWTTLATELPSLMLEMR
jgi:HD-like signal output (HDOD) protein